MTDRSISPCPFCGCESSVKIPYPGTDRVVECSDCHASGPQKRTAGEAVTAWNASADSLASLEFILNHEDPSMAVEALKIEMEEASS